MTDPAGISEMELHAYIDGVLDDARAAAVAAQLQNDPALAARVAGFLRDKAMLTQAFGGTDAPLPQDWLDRIEQHKPQARWPWRNVAAIAAVLLVVAAGAGLWLKPQGAQPHEIVAAALAARGETLAHAQPVAVASNDAGHYSGALSQAVAMKLKIPDLQRMGYRLTGLTLYRDQRSAQLAYSDGKGQTFSLYIRHSDGAPRFDQFEQAGLRVCVWQDNAIGTVMTGNVSTAAMQRLASLAYEGLMT